MAASRKSINLLPVELVASGSTLRNAKLLTTVSMGLFGLVIFMSILGGVSIYYFNSEKKDATSKVSDLKANIVNLQSAEQGLVLTKDRVVKIEEVLSARDVEARYQIQKYIVNSFPEGMLLEESEIESSGLKLIVDVINSAVLYDFVSSLRANESITSVNVKSLSYTPFDGYKFEMIIN